MTTMKRIAAILSALVILGAVLTPAVASAETWTPDPRPCPVAYQSDGVMVRSCPDRGDEYVYRWDTTRLEWVYEFAAR